MPPARGVVADIVRNVIDRGESSDGAERAARRALTLQPSSASAYVALGAFAALAFTAFIAFAFLCECINCHQAKPGDGRHEFKCELIHSSCWLEN